MIILLNFYSNPVGIKLIRTVNHRLNIIDWKTLSGIYWLCFSLDMLVNLTPKKKGVVQK